MNINWLAVVWLSLILFFYILYSQPQTCPAGDWLVFVLQTNTIQKCYGETTLILSSFYIFIIINSLGFFFLIFFSCSSSRSKTVQITDQHSDIHWIYVDCWAKGSIATNTRPFIIINILTCIKRWNISGKFKLALI